MSLNHVRIESSQANQMLLSISELEVKKLQFDQTYQPGEIDFSDENVKQTGPLTTVGVAELLPHTGEEIRVQGRVIANLEAECDRCLGTAKFAIDSPYDLFYRPNSVDDLEDEHAIDEGEAEIGFYDFPGIELEDIVREQVVLQLPMQHVCREDCKGICPVCGLNRNEHPCHCEIRPGDDRWQALKDIAQA